MTGTPEIVALAFAIPVVLIGVLLTLLSPILDLIRRPVTVPWWWGAPLLLLLPGVAGIVLMYSTSPSGRDRFDMVSGGLGFLHLEAAGLLLWMTLGLVLSRGLRPGGETRRKRRTTAVSLALLVGLLLSVLSVPWLPSFLLLMLWVHIPAWIGLFWVALLNREGPPRLMNARRASAGWLVASAVCAGFALLHPVLHLGGRIDVEFWIWAGMSAVAVLGFVGGLRVLTPIGWVAPAVATIVGAMSLAIPSLWLALYRPLPDGVVVPEFVNLLGERGPTLPLARLSCIVVFGKESQSCGPYDADYGQLAIPPDAPLSKLRISSGQTFLVNQGLGSLTSWSRYETPLVIREVNGRAEVMDAALTFEVGPGLHAYLQQFPTRPLVVVRTPNWTMADFVAMCASTGPEPACSVVPLPPR